MRLTGGIRLNSIRKKLFLLVIVNGGFALLLVAVLLFGYERIETREAAKRELSSQAGIVADSSAAALTFLDNQAAADTLKALHGDANIVQAGTYARDGSLFAAYERGDPDSGHLPRRAAAEGSKFESGYLMMSLPIRLGNEVLGTVFLKASTKDADAQLRHDMGFVFLVLLVSLALALLLTTSMQRTITGPLAELSNLARLVSVERDYSARAVKRTDDEVGLLVDSFNGMLTQIEAREQALRESEERYALAARGANDGLWDWNLTTSRVYWSSRLNQMLGYPDEETWSGPERWFESLHNADVERVNAEVAAHIEGRTKELVTECRIRQKSGGYIWVLSRGIAVRDKSGKAIRMAGSMTDITRGKVADPLTGLPNRLYFLDRLENALDVSMHNGAHIAVLFLDLDGFKLVNDSLGHAAGDMLLKGVSNRLRSSIAAARGSGNAGECSLVARLGGDEFAVLLELAEGAPAAARFAEAILKDVNAPYLVGGHQVFVGLSIGVALSSPPDSGQRNSPDELLRNADTAMYRAKTAGKARFALFDESMRRQAIARLEIETELRNGIENGELLLHYQPQVSIDGQRLTGFEALVRWMHPRRGMVPPAEFIPVAEETGLIVSLGKWVLREACRQMVQWQDRYGLSPSPTIAVNVSFRQLVGKGFVDDVRRILRETGLAPSALRLEMTESAVMKDPEESIETLRHLKELGLALEIDDFGTGYSSLSYLSSLPFDTVKIDRSFVTGLGGAEDHSEIVKTIVELARSLNMDVIAEGVETETERRKLVELGCERAQGYYFSKPLPAVSAPAVFEVEALKRAFGGLKMQPGSAIPSAPMRATAAAKPSGGDLERLVQVLGDEVSEFGGGDTAAVDDVSDDEILQLALHGFSRAVPGLEEAKRGTR